MGNFEALVEVQLRPGISDPKGATIERALPALGFTVCYAIANTLLTIWGVVIVLLLK